MFFTALEHLCSVQFKARVFQTYVVIKMRWLPDQIPWKREGKKPDSEAVGKMFLWMVMNKGVVDFKWHVETKGPDTGTFGSLESHVINWHDVKWPDINRKFTGDLEARRHDMKWHDVRPSCVAVYPACLQRVEPSGSEHSQLVRGSITHWMTNQTPPQRSLAHRWSWKMRNKGSNAATALLLTWHKQLAHWL